MIVVTPERTLAAREIALALQSAGLVLSRQREDDRNAGADPAVALVNALEFMAKTGTIHYTAALIQAHTR